jgi:hypothetical protein
LIPPEDLRRVSDRRGLPGVHEMWNVNGQRSSANKTAPRGLEIGGDSERHNDRSLLQISGFN